MKGWKKGHSRKTLVCKGTLAVHFDEPLVTEDICGEGAVLGKARPTGKKQLHTRGSPFTFNIIVLVFNFLYRLHGR